MAGRKIPRILDDYLESTEQWASAYQRGIELSDAHLLKEAEWCLYNAYQNEGSSAYNYNGSSKAALRRYVERQQAAGIRPAHDFEL